MEILVKNYKEFREYCEKNANKIFIKTKVLGRSERVPLAFLLPSQRKKVVERWWRQAVPEYSKR